MEPGQCTIVEDEADNIEDEPEKMKILKCGYEYDARVPRINMNLENQPPFGIMLTVLKF